MTNSLLTIITFVPLLGALLTLLPWGKWLKLDRPREERLIKYGAIAISLLPLGLAIALWFGYDKAIGGMQFQVNVPWITMLNINYHMGVDGLSVPLVFLTTFLTTLGLYYSSRVIKVRVREFFFLFLLLEMGMLGVFVSLDLVLFYVFWEVGLVPMYFLIGIWGQPKDRPQYSAIKFFLYTLTGSIFMLLAILGIYVTTGTFDMLEAARLQPFAGNVVLSSLAFFAFFLAFAIKVPSWPFHTWLPDANTAAPTAGSVLLAGVLLKLGAYGMLRILLPIFPEAFKRYAILVIALGVISIIYGALVSLAQKDMKKLVAYSSVSHMGFITMGMFALNAPGLRGSILQMINHGISTGALFLLVGIIYERRHNRMISEYGGLAKVMPLYATFFMIIALSSLGLPTLNGFIGEFTILIGAFHHSWVWALFAATGIVLGAAYLLWMYQRVFFGEITNDKNKNLTDLNLREQWTLIPLIVMAFWIGLYPKPFFRLMEPTVDRVLQRVAVAMPERETAAEAVAAIAAAPADHHADAEE